MMQLYTLLEMRDIPSRLKLPLLSEYSGLMPRPHPLSLVSRCVGWLASLGLTLQIQQHNKEWLISSHAYCRIFLRSLFNVILQWVWEQVDSWHCNFIFYWCKLGHNCCQWSWHTYISSDTLWISIWVFLLVISMHLHCNILLLELIKYVDLCRSYQLPVWRRSISWVQTHTQCYLQEVGMRFIK